MLLVLVECVYFGEAVVKVWYINASFWVSLHGELCIDLSLGHQHAKLVFLFFSLSYHSGLRWLVLTMLLCLCSVLSKETGITVLAVCLMYECFILNTVSLIIYKHFHSICDVLWLELCMLVCLEVRVWSACTVRFWLVAQVVEGATCVAT